VTGWFGPAALHPVGVGVEVAHYQRTATTITSAGKRSPVNAVEEEDTDETKPQTSSVNHARPPLSQRNRARSTALSGRFDGHAVSAL
jgi:hypothetical protein